MSEAGSANSDFKTPETYRPEMPSSQSYHGRSHSKDRGRSGSNNRDGGAPQGRDGSNDRDRGRNRQDSGRNNDQQKDNRDRSHSRERQDKNKQQNNHSPRAGWGGNSSQQQNNHSPQAGWGGNNSQQGPRCYQSQQGHYNRCEEDGYYGQYNTSPNQQNKFNKQQRGRGSQGSPWKHDKWQGGYDGAGFGSGGQTPGRNYQRWDEDPDVFLSKTLSSILRHNAERFGFTLMKGGFLFVDDILFYVKKLHGFTIEDVRRVVESNDKKRFTLEMEEGRLKIRANQGHSIEVEDLELKPILSADDFPTVIHGTYFSKWDLIKRTGLRRMNRNHIHFAAGEPGRNGVISGMRKTCEVMIKIDLEKALKAGLKFFLSSNNVILSPGDEDGVIYPCYFSGVVDRMYYHKIDFDHTISSAQIKNENPAEKYTEKPSEGKKRKKKNKGKGKQQNDDDEHKEEKEAKTEDIKEQKSEKGAKEKEDEASTDDMSLPVAKKQHLSEPAETEPPKAECSRMKKEEAKPTIHENDDPEEDEVKSKDWLEPVEVTTADESIRVVNELCDTEPSHIAVTCVGENLGRENSKIRMIVISCHPETYVYHFNDDNKSLIKDGHLDQLFLNKTVPKVFHDIRAISSGLIHEFDILMDGVPIWDISILCDKVKVPHMDMEELGYKEGLFKQWTRQNEEFGKKVSSCYDPEIVSALFKRGKLISDLYRICSPKLDEILKKRIRKEIFEAAIPSKESFLAEKVEALKIEMKGKKAAEKPASQSPQKQPQQQQKGKSGKGKHGKGGKKR